MLWIDGEVDLIESKIRVSQDIILQVRSNRVRKLDKKRRF